MLPSELCFVSRLPQFFAKMQHWREVSGYCRNVGDSSAIVFALTPLHHLCGINESAT
jgi:hypothetical protein